MSETGHVLTLSCENRTGIVATVSSALFAINGDIFSAQQFDDPETGRFFMRVLFAAPSEEAIDAFRTSFDKIARDYAMEWRLRDRSRRQRVLIMASKFDHCLVDLLYRKRIGEISMDIAAIVSNHPSKTYEGVDFADAPFYHLPVTSETKPQQEAALWKLITEKGVDLVILARYMQVLSAELAAKVSGRCINIHHSFLPSFKGGRPYHQAYERGVKIIGATAHYVTADLDEGPIIEQDVERIGHADTPADLIRRGRDIERRVMAKAVRYHLEDRVMLNGKKTVVFEN
ncbi:MAG: formyltetrahydrofolate deformylase [Pseudomonadota bacterium]